MRPARAATGRPSVQMSELTLSQRRRAKFVPYWFRIPLPSAADRPLIDDAPTAQAALLPGLYAPLQHLVAAAELLERQRLTPEARACARAILESGRTLLNVVEDLRRLNAMTHEPAAPSSCGLYELTEDIESLWRLQTAPSDGRLLIACHAPEGAKVELDGDAAKLLLNALIRRALGEDAAGVVEVQIGLSAHEGAGELKLSVSQSRAGWRPQEQDSALLLAEKLADRMGGSFRILPHLGLGERVEITQSVKLAATETEGAAEEASVLPEQTHILIVDDNATNRMVAAALCEMFGCTTETAEDGVEAVEAARSTRFDLILMDIRMPRMDGVEATRAVRRLPGALGRTPIVALTANGDPEAARLYIAAGMDGVVEKPIKPERLLETLQSALERRGGAVAASSAA